MIPLFKVKPHTECDKCKLDQGCESPRMPWTGEGSQKILFVGEAPGYQEDLRNEQFVGQAGNILRDHLDELDFDLDYDGWKDNVCACHPPENKTPTAAQIKYCRPHLLNTIEELKPEKIILLGLTAVKGLLQDRVPDTGKMADWVGWKIPDKITNAWIFPTYHPSYILRKENKGRYEEIFHENLKTAIEHTKPFPILSEENYQIHILNEQEAIDYLDSLICGTISIDYETTGLKPHKNGHQIVSMSISPDENNAYTFLITRKMVKNIRRVLNDKRVGLQAQNMKFERMWSKVIFGTPGAPWVWDSLLASHLLNNQASSALKFQTYVNFGIPDYSKDVDRFLKATTANGFNQIHQIPHYTLLKYNGNDTIWERRLSITQKQIILPDKKLLMAYRHAHQGSLALSDTEIYGFRIDLDHYNQQSFTLEKRSTALEQEIFESKEGRVWKAAYGTDSNLDSSHQMADVLFKRLKHKSIKETKKSGQPSVDKETLHKLDIPIVKKIIQFRETNKLNATYIKQIMREEVDGIVHPFIDLLAITWRSNVSKPSYQNIPSRIPESAAAIRKGFIPRPGLRFVDADYSGIEVAVSACYHKDPTMIDYLWDKTKDMHRDMTMECYILDPDEVTKDARKCGKNSFVFPEFYGDYFINCAKNLWEDIDTYDLRTQNKQVPFKEHLKKHGISTYNKFEDHIQEVEIRFWEDRFKVYNQWKKDTWLQYLDTGYLQSYFGFIFTGGMDRNNALNYQIQSTAFHLLLWAYIRMNRSLKQNKMRTHLIGETHDSAVAEVCPFEFVDFLTMMKKIMVDDLLKEFPWIIIPIEIEIEACEIDEPWYYKKFLESYRKSPKIF